MINVQIAINRRFTGKLPLGDRRWGTFNDSFENVTLALDELIAEIQAGHAYTPQHQNGHRCAKNFTRGQHLGLDFDTCDDRSTLRALVNDPFIATYGSFLHTTASHTQDKPRARAVFILEQAVEAAASYGEMAAALNWKYTGYADTNCKDAARLFFGAVGCVVRKIGNTLPLNVIQGIVADFKAWNDAQQAAHPRTAYRATTPELASVEAALRFIPPQGDYFDWLHVLMAVHSEYPGADGVGVCENWSPGYPGEVERKFKSFRPQGNARGRRGIGTLFALAQQHGYRGRWRDKTTTSDTRHTPPGEPDGVPGGDPPEREHTTDLGNARRLVKHANGNLRYGYRLGWLWWDGKRWADASDGYIARCAQGTARGIYGEAAQENDADKRKRIAQWAAASESDGRQRAMLHLAESQLEIALTPQDLDADPNLFNCANGTLNLTTGELQPHEKANLITRLAPVDFDHDARLQLWDTVLHDLTGSDAGVADLLQKAAGYSLTGKPTLDVLLALIAPAGSGKSTFLGAIRGTWGDYAEVIPFDTLLERPHTGARPELARLRGARFVYASELSENKRLDAGTVKAITGGDPILVRKLYSEPFEFKPQFVLWLGSNSEPQVDADDTGMWRRLVKIIFPVIPEDKRDPAVRETLTNPDIAGAAILAWAWRGLLKLRSEGWTIPEPVKKATEDYRQGQDPLAGFITERCYLGPDDYTVADVLRVAYESWCKSSGDKTPVSGKRWGDLLRSRGCTPGPKRIGDEVKWCWHGIELIIPEDL